MIRSWSVAVFVLCSALAPCVPAATLEVGPGKRFARIEEANAHARPGDVILVYPRDHDLPYERTAVFVRQTRLTFRAAPAPRRVSISGQGFNYSGQGSVPRAIFQFNRGTDHCVLEGFELTGAHNGSHNGAGVRINQANHITIRNCEIHHNDMGIMSNGDGTEETGVDQRIEHCQIHHNGDPADPGHNHNLYLGGTSATLSFCDVHSSLTGHNVKSRAHHTRIQYCYVHHSSNREFDLVDGADTARPESHAVLVGNIIVKDPQCPGNRGVIHFGQDGGKEHDGTIHLLLNTIVTPHISPVLELSAANAKARLLGNLVSNGGVRQRGQRLLAVRGGAGLASIGGHHNWLRGDFEGESGTTLDARTNPMQRIDAPLFGDPARHDYRLRQEARSPLDVVLSPTDLALPPVPGAARAREDVPGSWQYRHPADKERRLGEPAQKIGACSRAP
jgi:hypothetical protein